MNHCGTKLATRVVKSSEVSEHPVIGAVSPDGSAYVHFIPKNSSSYIRTCLLKEQWHELVYADHILNRHYPAAQLAVIRDPVDRWASGITQFLFDTFKSFTPIANQWEAIVKIIMAQPNQDAHTTPQANFFYNYNLDGIDFAYLDTQKNINQQVIKWGNLVGQTFKFLDRADPSNQSKKDPTKESILDFLQQNLNNNNNFKQRIVDYYTVDYELIEWIGKNNKWIQ